MTLLIPRSSYNTINNDHIALTMASKMTKSEGDKSSKGGKDKMTIWIIIIVVLLLLGGGAWYYYSQKGKGGMGM